MVYYLIRRQTVLSPYAILKEGEMLLQDVDLRQLSQTASEKRNVISAYLATATGIDEGFFSRRINECRVLLDTSELSAAIFLKEADKIHQCAVDAAKEEKQAIAVFSCHELSFFETVVLPATLDNLIVIDYSPFILPLAELTEEYEPFAIVLADHHEARMYIVTATEIAALKRLTKDIHRRTNKGGWSQMRYQRRRQNQVLQFCKEIVGELNQLLEQESVRRIILGGDKEIIAQLRSVMPRQMQIKVVDSLPIDMDISDEQMLQQIFPAFWASERREEMELVEQLKDAKLGHGLGVSGLSETLEAVQLGKAELVLINKDLETVLGWRCANCGYIGISDVKRCPYCEGNVNQINVLEELIEVGSAFQTAFEFVEHNDLLQRMGGIGALLRYR